MNTGTDASIHFKKVHKPLGFRTKPTNKETIMKLLTKEIKAKLISNDKKGRDKPIEQEYSVCKFFDPTGSWTWYAYSIDDDGYLFGYVAGSEPEYGLFHIKELEEVRLPFGLGIERDAYYRPELFKDITNRHLNIYAGG